MSNRFVELAFVMTVAALAGCQSAPSPQRTADGAQSPITQAQLIEVDDTTLAQFEEALTAMQAQRYTEAEKLLKGLTVRNPQLSGPWANLGAVYAALGDDAAAVAAYKQAITVNPDNCAAYTELGVLSRRSGDFLSAEANYLACVSRVPNFREAYLNLGILYELYLGRLDDALNAYQTYQALSDAPDRRVAGWVSDLERRLAGNES